MISELQAEKILDTYSLVELLEINELTEAEVLCFLIEHKRVVLPDPLPVDMND